MNALISGAASLLFGSVSAATDKIKTWGRNIKWVSLKEGQKLVKEHVHFIKQIRANDKQKALCDTNFVALRPRFANSKDIEQLSADFVMINVEEDDSPKSSDLMPDGAYIPRILFMDPSGNIMKNVTNKGSEGYRYYYNETKAIVDNMKHVLKQTTTPRYYKTK